MTVSIPDDLFFYVGEKPPPTPWRYEDNDGNLDPSIAGATITLLVNIDGDAGAEQSITCTNADDGTGTIVWPTGTSAMKLDTGIDRGTMRCDMHIVASPLDWFMDRFSLPIIRRR